MSELEQIYNDTRSWMYFQGESEDETIGVYCRCPECSKYVKRGELLTNMNGDVKLQGFICKRHGEIQPYFDRFWGELNI